MRTLSRSLARFRPLAASAAAAALLAGCMGSFTLTKKLYAFNETITDSKVINNVIFWGLNIVPVYSLAVTGDAVILNTIEFWTGTNLLADAGGDTDVRVVDADGRVTVTRGTEVIVVAPVDDASVDVYRDGVLVGRAVRGADGGIVAKDADGHVLAVLDAVDVDAASGVVADHAVAD